jgi:hypothetical protein
VGRLTSIGWELGTVTADVETTANATGAPTVPTTFQRSGASSLRISSLTSAQQKGSRYTFKSASNNGPFYGRVYLTISTLPSAENRIIALVSDASFTAANNRLYLTLDNTGALALFDEDGQIGSDSSPISRNTRYRIEFEIDTSAAAGSHIVKARIDGVEFASATNRSISSGVMSAALGGNLNSEAQTAGDWYFDDFAINDNSGSFQNTYPGSAREIHLKPNADGDNSGWDATSGYLEIDETTPDDASTIISTGTLDSIQDVNIEPPAYLGTSDPVNLVAVGVRFRMESGLDGADFCLRIKASASGTVEESSSVSYNSLTAVTNAIAAPRNYALTLYDLPGASTTAWTKTDLTTTQIGVRCTTASGTSVQISTLWLLVDFTPATDSSTTVECVSGSIAVNAAVGLQEILTGLSFTPKVIILTTNDLTAAGSAVNARVGYGMTCFDNTKMAMSVHHVDGAASMNTDRYVSDRKSIVLNDSSGNVVFDADAVFSSDGFGINITTTDGTARLLNYYILGGNDITDATIKMFTSPTSTGSQATAGVGFQPDFMLLASNSTSTAPPSTATAGLMSLGWGTSSTARGAMSFNEGNGGTNSIEEKVQVTDKILHQTNGGAAFLSADLTSLDANGFTLNWSTVQASARYCFALCIKGGLHKVGTITQPTSAQSQATSGLGFTPDGLMTLSFNEAATGSLVEEINNTIGAATSSSARWAIGVDSLDNAPNGDCDQVLSTTSVIRSLTPSTLAVEEVADLTSLDTDGFTLNFTTADATQRQTLYWAVGNPAAAGGGAFVSPPQRMRRGMGI